MRIYVEGKLLPENTPVTVLFESSCERTNLAIDLMTNGAHATIIGNDQPDDEEVRTGAIEGVKALFAEKGLALPKNLLVTSSDGEEKYNGEFPKS